MDAPQETAAPVEDEEKDKKGPITVNKGKKKKNRGAITQKNAAALCGVSPRQLQKWEKGQATPERYPGRGDVIVFKAWAMGYQQKKALDKEVFNMERATPMDPQKMDKKFSKGAAMDVLDRGDNRSLEELKAEQEADRDH